MEKHKFSSIPPRDKQYFLMLLEIKKYIKDKINEKSTTMKRSCKGAQ
jgi:hypothetical protein